MSFPGSFSTGAQLEGESAFLCDGKAEKCEPRAANSHIPQHVEEANLQQEKEVNMQRTDGVRTVTDSICPSGPSAETPRLP